MTKQKPVPFPDIKDFLLYFSGATLGFFTPSFIFTIVPAVKNNSFLKNYVFAKGSMVERVKGVLSLNTTLTTAIIFVIIAVILLVAFRKSTEILYKVGIGFLLGFSFRVIIAVLGVRIPFVSPAVNQTANITIEAR